jgi:predicted metal-dependent hydrolase
VGSEMCIRDRSNSPVVNGVEIFIPFKDTGAIKTMKNLIEDNSELVDGMSGLFKLFNKALKVIDKKAKVSIAMLPPIPKRYGNSLILGFKPNVSVTGYDGFFVNPFGIYELLESFPAFAALEGENWEKGGWLFADTMVHEYAHTKVAGHGADFTNEMSRISLALEKSIPEIITEARNVYKTHEGRIQDLNQSIKDLSEYGDTISTFAGSARSEYNRRRRERSGRKQALGEKSTTGSKAVKERGEAGITLASGFDPVEAVKAIRDLGKDIKAAIPHLETLGKHYYTGGKQRYFDWQKKMKGALGDLWTKVKKYIGEVWKGLKRPLKNEKGAVTIPVREIKATTKRNIKRTKKLLDEKLGALTTRLEKISPSIKNKIIEFELDTGVKVEKIAKDVMLPFIEKTTKMSKKDYDTFDLARKERNKKEIDDLVEKYGMEEEYKKVRGMLDAIGNEARAVGYKFNYLKDYHPRQIIDFEGLMDYLYETGNRSTIEFFIEAKEKKLGRKLTNEEEIKLVNSLFRGYADERITLSKPGQLKLRKLKKIGLEIMEFYGDSNSALLRYVNDIVLAVEAKKLFGDYKIEGLDLNETIGAYILRVSKEKRLTPSQELELRSMLHARFNPVGTSGIVTTFKNLAVIDVMGSPASALRQVGDIGWSMIENGTFASSKAFGKAMVGNFISQKYGSEFIKEDLGISKIGAEFSDKTLSAKAVDSVFRVIWLTKIDAIGKEVLINAAYDIAVRKAKSKDTKVRDAFINKLIPIFENRTDALMEDFRSGVKSRDVKLYLLRKLSEYQPATLSELPQGFIEGGNARIAYMLKSFDLKKFDVYRRKVFQQIAKPGTRIQGIKNLFKIAFFLTLMEATGDTLIDLFLGKPINISDTVVGRILGLAISRYTTSKIRREGPGALLEQILPPTQFINSIFRDVVSAGDGKGLEFTKSIPLVGKFYYYRWGKGLEKVEKDREKNQSKNAISRIRKIQRKKRKISR